MAHEGSMNSLLSRREALAAACLHGLALTGAAQEKPAFQLASFTAEVTPPLGHACMGGGIAAVQKIEDPLFVNGLVVLGVEKPVVIAAIDWCEIRNDAYDRWRAVLAEAARTTPERVLFSSVHQHDTPIADLEAQRLLEQAKAKGSICDLEFHEKTVQRVSKSLRDCLASPRKVTHLGMGQAKVAEVASNRRFVTADGKPNHGRMSATRDPKIREYPEGTIDPWLKLLSFWDDDKAIAILGAYATHPMSYYGKGGVTADFVGVARKRFQADHPQAAVLYLSGCSGNVTAGKYNDGAPENRPVLADKIYKAMTAAWEATKKQPLQQANFRSVKLRLEPRNDAGFKLADLTKRLTTDPKPFGQCLAALGLSWRKRADAGHQLDVPAIDFGPAQYLLLPAEAYVEFQLHAQQTRLDGFVMTAGYGECAPGYIPTEKAVDEKDSNLHDWCWVAPGAEKAMQTAIETVLKPAGK